MSFMPPTDSMFLLVESREHPMHVGGLQLFEPPDGAGPDHVADLVESFRSGGPVNRLFSTRPAAPVGLVGTAWWGHDDDVDLDHHVRHSAVPQPGRVRELLQATSRWHSGLLDRHRPLWECHVVEGLADGRFAVYTKVHHAMLDGVAALRQMQRSLSTDPDARDCVPPWQLPDRDPVRSVPVGGRVPWGLVRGLAGAAGELAGLVPASLRIVDQAIREGDVTLPRAPKTMLNVPVGGARRFAAQSWDIERIQRVATSSATTINDVVLAMVSGALRAYLLEHHALPDEPLTAMVPVSLALRAGSDSDSGNAVGTIVVNLATDRENGSTRLEEIAYSSKSAKKILGDLTPTQILAFSALQMAPLALGPVPGFVRWTHPPFNVIVSNVPGPTEDLYLNGSRLDGMYPASIALDGQAVNITLTSRKGFVDVGIVGCRRTVPHLQRLLGHLEDALAELERSWG